MRGRTAGLQATPETRSAWENPPAPHPRAHRAIPLCRTCSGFDDHTAQLALAGPGLAEGTVRTGSSCASARGDVYSQDPGVGTAAQPVQAVNLVEANGLDAHNEPCIIQ